MVSRHNGMIYIFSVIRHKTINKLCEIYILFVWRPSFRIKTVLSIHRLGLTDNKLLPEFETLSVTI